MFTSIERSCLQCSHVRIYDSGDSYGMQLFEKRCLVRVRNYVIFEANQSDDSRLLKRLVMNLSAMMT